MTGDNFINGTPSTMTGRTINLAERIYFAKINRKRAKHALFSMLKKTLFVRARFSIPKIAEFGKLKTIGKFI